MLGEEICKCEGDTEIAIFQTGEASLSYFVFPSMGDRPMMTEARADLTCWLASETSSLTQGRMWFMMTVSWRLRSRFWQKSLTLWAAAARTSASQSFNRFCWGREKNQQSEQRTANGRICYSLGILLRTWKAGTRSVFVISFPTAFCRSVNLSATMKRTLQDLSSAQDLSVGITNCSTSSFYQTKSHIYVS